MHLNSEKCAGHAPRFLNLHLHRINRTYPYCARVHAPSFIYGTVVWAYVCPSSLDSVMLKSAAAKAAMAVSRCSSCTSV